MRPNQNSANRRSRPSNSLPNNQKTINPLVKPNINSTFNNKKLNKNVNNMNEEQTKSPNRQFSVRKTIVPKPPNRNLPNSF